MAHIAFAVFVGAVLLGAGAGQAACVDTQPKPGHIKKHPQPDTCINLTAVPQISAGIAAKQPAPLHKTPGYALPADSPYQGPILGMTKPDPGVKPVPTVGYHWSLE